MNKKQIKLLIWYAVIMLVLPIIISMVIGMVYGAIQGVNGVPVEEIATGVQDYITNAMIYIIAVIYVALGLLVFFMYRQTYIDEYQKIENKQRFYIQTLIIGLIIFLINFGTSNLLSWVGVPESENQALVEGFISKGFVITLITAGLIAPFIEELVFRYIIQNALMKYGKIVAIIGSSLIFTLIHFGGSVLSLIPYFVIGLCLGITYYKTKNINIAVGAHMINNVVAIVLSVLGL